jgi:hypothetical protein
VSNIITIPTQVADALRRHLFQNDLEQGAFLFARTVRSREELNLAVEDFYLVPPNGWETQMDVYLEMKDSERAKIMKLARDKDLAAIDCHSHPRADGDVWFSPSDIFGITEFAEYAKWKLNGKPFAATVWGERSVDGVLWLNDSTSPLMLDQVKIVGVRAESLVPKGTWFRKPRRKHRFWIDD